MRIVFCGTPSFAVPTFQHLLAQSEFEVIGVITQPDRPRGRGQEISFSPVKEAALAANLPVHQPEKIRRSEEHTSELQSHSDLVCRLLLEKKKKKKKTTKQYNTT